MDGAMTAVCFIADLRSFDAARLAYLLICRVDLARTFLGAALEFFGHVAELVRMMLADQAAVRVLDLALAGTGFDTEDRVRILAGARARIPRLFVAAAGPGVRVAT